ncbi:iron-containing alcohol dehydrogenase family protein [Mangrovicoccus algicola]|uniref:Iron-containing alcohol dehydrogenase n=1 Tax=Mangrovicoccus algicola TaxID=2771008 RepID=A0A8J6Z2N8_9RHOB|nr:iron-containing alcohol dehydrogenase [Mangrovicoccus algicola]MBE3640551.1 iron-containing alcohol dehydrogenase [Mangrovicoccus algicola]
MHVLTDPIEIQQPPVLHFGDGTLARLAPWVAAQGHRRPFVVTGPGNAARLDLLGLGTPACFAGAAPEPELHDLAAAVRAAEAAEADLVIGYGGGSAMDLAKLVAVMAGQGLELDRISGPGRAPPRRAGLVQIPTTAGTGSETGTRALVSDPATRAKIATESPHMLADMAIVDPRLTHSVPPALTAATGLDALAHCAEALTSKRAHPLVDTLALEGIALAGRYLARAVRDGADAEARAGMALASLRGGQCLGPVNTTAGHALAYPLGTRAGLPHGLANALIFPHVLAANAAAAPQKTAQIAAALGLAGTGLAGAGDGLRDAAVAFCRGLGIEMSLGAHGVSRDALPQMAQEAHAIRRLMDWNPVDLSVADIRAIYDAAF